MFTSRIGGTILCKVALSICLCEWDLSASQLGGEFENVVILVAIAVNEDGYHEV